MAAQAWFSSGDVDVAPGTTAVLQLTVVNLSDTTDSFVLTPVGMAAAWTTLRPATLTLFGGTQEIVDVELSPPMLPGTAAGPTSLSVRVVPQNDPDNLSSAETSLIIGESYDRRLNLLQPAMRGRRGAVYEMMLENRGNTQASCRLHVVDPTGRVEGQFDPPAAGVEPGASTLVRLKLRTDRLQWDRRPRTIPFRVDADQAGSPTASAAATFVQTPMVPERLVGRVAGIVVALALLAGAWFGLMKPAIEHAADDAVRNIVPPTTVQVPTSESPVNSEVVTTTVPAAEQETIVNVPLPLSVPQGQTGANQYTVPAGKRLRVTDIIVQNPQLDQGSLSVSRNTNALFTYNLTNTFNDVSPPLVTPIELLAGEQLVVSVTCDGVGDQTATACAPRVLVSGVLVPA